jgi:subtilase family serine protease
MTPLAGEFVVYRISLHFDWMPSGDFYSYDLSADPVHIPGNGSRLFELTNIQLMAGASSGAHSYYVSADVVQNGVNFVWDSPSLTLQIYDGNEKIYNELEPQISNRLHNTTYTNANAQSLLQQANNEYETAISLADNGTWLEAVSSLRAASDYLDQADVAEQIGGPSLGTLLLYLAIVVIAVVIAILVVAIVVRRARKKTGTVEPEEPVEPVEPAE